MISFEPFYETLKKNNMTTYKLIKDHNISRSLLDRLKHNKPLSTVTVDDLCKILHCKVQDIMVFIDEWTFLVAKPCLLFSTQKTLNDRTRFLHRRGWAVFPATTRCVSKQITNETILLLHSINIFCIKLTPTTTGDHRSAPTIVGVNFSFHL